MTMANSSGVMTGITSSRGVRTLSARRRRARVATAARPPWRPWGAAATRVGRSRVGEMVVIRSAPSSGVLREGVGGGGMGWAGSRGEGLAGELQVDVVESRGPAGDGADGQTQVGDRGDGVAAGAAALRDVNGGADHERVPGGDAMGAQRRDGG